MSYTRNFGMRSFENVVRDGRFRVPATGTPLVIGSPVELDPATPGYLKVATATTVAGPNCGILVFEHFQNKSDALTTAYDAPHDVVPLGQYAQMMHGQGTKVWFKNTAQKTLYDGRVRPAAGLLAASVNVATLAIGAGLAPDGSGKYVVEDGVTPNTWLVVEQVNPTTGLVEARFNF